MATVEQIARVLDEHRSKPTGSPYCTCGWRPGLMLNDAESDRQQHIAHQAEQVAALDEPTHTEWGVVNPDAIEAHYAEKLADTWEDGYLAGLHDARRQSSSTPVTSNPHRRSNA